MPAVVLSGSEIAFRMVACKGDKAVGQLVVRVDGRWVEADFSGGVKPVGIKWRRAARLRRCFRRRAQTPDVDADGEYQHREDRAHAEQPRRDHARAGPAATHASGDVSRQTVSDQRSTAT